MLISAQVVVAGAPYNKPDDSTWGAGSAYVFVLPAWPSPAPTTSHAPTATFAPTVSLVPTPAPTPGALGSDGATARSAAVSLAGAALLVLV